MLYLHQLRCEYRINPLGIDIKNPRVSWIIKSRMAGTLQTAFRVLVASSPENLHNDKGDLWDSGTVESDQSIDIPYNGKELASREKCYWKVKIRDNHGNESPWSDVMQWSMGLLEKKDWQAEWIGLDQEEFGQFRNAKMYAPCYFRNAFHVDRKVASATLYASALGWYQFHINGRRVGNDYFTPGWTDFRIRIYYNTYDVTEYLNDGDNAIGGILSGGWYHWPDRGEKARLLGQLEVTFQDGSRQIIRTDGSWKASTGPEKYAHILFGESCDMRHNINGWDNPAFDDSTWEAPQTGLQLREALQTKYHVPAEPVLEAYPADPVRCVKEHHPVKMSTLTQREAYIFDMGTNYAGFVRIKIKNTLPGQIIHLRFGDWLNRDGTLYTENLRLARHMMDEYICQGGEEEIWEPRFSFRGHRYVEVSGWSNAKGPDLQSVVGIELTQSLSSLMKFSCGNETINKLFAALEQTRRANTIEAPTDCSQRDERQGWCGDALFFSNTANFLADMQPFYRKWLTGVMDGQNREGGFARLAPSNHGYYANDGDGLPAWADTGVLLPWQLYQYYGDTEILKKFYPAICRYIHFRISTLQDYLPDETGFFYGDWNSIDSFWGSKTSEWGADTFLVYSAYTAKTVRTAVDIAKVLRMEKDAVEFNNIFNELKAAFNRKYVNKNGMIRPTQGNCAMALSFGLLDKETEKKAAEQLMEEFRKNNWKIGTGTVSTPEVLFAFSRSGYIAEAYNILLNESFPSWGYMIKSGATAIWEHWGSRRPELPDSAPLFNPCDPNETHGPGFDCQISPWMNSGNHPAFGSVGDWIVRNIGGINQLEPGFKKIMIKPFIDKRLGHALTSYGSAYGTIVSEWMVEGNKAKMKVEIPANTSAQIYVSSNGKCTTSTSSEAKMKEFMASGQYHVFETGSGKFEFDWQLDSFEEKIKRTK